MATYKRTQVSGRGTNEPANYTTHPSSTKHPLAPVAWYAIEFPGTGVFGIVDFFPSKEGMDAHLQGKVAEALFANVDALLTQAPDVMPLEVLAAKAA